MTTTQETGGRRLSVFALGESRTGEGKTRWTRIGTAFENRDGSITLLLNAFPIGTDRLQVREDRDDDRQAGPPRRAAPRAEEVRP